MEAPQAPVTVQKWLVVGRRCVWSRNGRPARNPCSSPDFWVILRLRVTNDLGGCLTDE